MASAGKVTTTGLTEMRAAVQRLPDAVTAALRDVARDTAERVKAEARRLLLAQQKTSAHALADAITVIEDPDNKRMLIESPPPPGQPLNVPIWNEYGTIFMLARPYMRPALDGEDAAYRGDMERASVDAAAAVLK